MVAGVGWEWLQGVHREARIRVEVAVAADDRVLGGLRERPELEFNANLVLGNVGGHRSSVCACGGGPMPEDGAGRRRGEGCDA